MMISPYGGKGTVRRSANAARRARVAVLISLGLVFLLVLFSIDTQQTTAADCDCTFCHSAAAVHSADWLGCSSCHDSPPQTASHLTHYGSAPVTVMTYGDTSITSDTNSYMFGCGNCHPLDNAKHQNGVLEVELYNPLAPEGSVKAKSPPSATYTPGTYTSYTKGTYTFSYSDGTCANIYCHSGYAVSSGPVGYPLTSPPNSIPEGFGLNAGAIMDETCSSLTYAPYTVNYQRVYTTTPTWGTSGTFTTCTECHAFPLTTWYPDVEGMVGDSHQWVDDYGWNWGHAYNMDGWYGIPCATCHYGTADHVGGVPPSYPQAANPPTYWTAANGTYIMAYNLVPLRSRALHVNGRPDVVFDTDNGYTYEWSGNHYDFQDATYDSATKTCSNVSCHYNPTGLDPKWQQKAKWGNPYRPYSNYPDYECDQCHRYGYLNEGCTYP